jgi:TrmH family RNA methyltransferase
MLITNPANERLKQARRVRDGREPALIFVEGERLVEECLQAGLPLTACFHAPAASARAQALLEELARRGCPLFPVAEAALNTLSDTVNTQGLIVLAARPAWTLAQALAAPGAEPALLVGLAAVQDPGNCGAILRTAEAAGAHGVIALTGTADLFAPKTLRSAMGAAFRLPLASGVSTQELLAVAREGRFTLAAATATGETVYSDYDWRQPTLLLLGNEAQGVSEDLLQRCDVRLRIPLRPPVESLNVAAAAAVLLFEAARQRW